MPVELQAEPASPARAAVDPIERERARARVRARLIGGRDAGLRIGRFELGERLGEGAMGVVWTARDPDLDREVALKVVRADRWAAHERTTMQARVLAEARALARLSHPHVVAVFDVGVHESTPFIAMERVVGQTLRQWQAARQPTWGEAIAVLSAVADGLVAVHHAGLVHRDIKPENVMMARDGRVLIMDLGIARGAPSATDEPTPGDRASTTMPDEPVAGTPAYMAPEQMLGTAVDERSDQFSFSVMAHELLYGVRPFRGTGIAQLILAITDGELVEPPAGARVPRWLRRVVVRGLASDPARRWPSMRALVDAIERGRRRARGRNMTVAVGAALVVAAGFGLRDDDAAHACDEASAGLDGAWDDDVRARVREALLATRVGYAPDTWSRVEARIDGWAQEWTGARAEACDAAGGDADASRMLDLRMACLSRRRAELAAVTAVLAEADAGVVERAVSITAGLRSVETCSAATVLAAGPTPPEADREADVEALRAEIPRVIALSDAARYDDAIALADELLGRARELDYDPLVAELAHRRGNIAGRMGDHETAYRHQEEAYYTALRARHDEIAAASAAMLVATCRELGRIDAAYEWAEHSRAALATMTAAGLDDLEPATLLHSHLGVLAHYGGDFDTAVSELQAAVALLEQPGTSITALGSGLANFSVILRSKGDEAAARRTEARALATFEAALGPDHPTVAMMLNNVGNGLRAAGELDAAREHFERATDILTRAFGPDHPHVAMALGNLGSVSNQQNDRAAARKQLERALEIWQRALGPEHRNVAIAATNLGLVLHELGELDEARSRLELARGIVAREVGEDHVEMADVLRNLADVAWESRDDRAAVELLAQALAIRERSQIPDAPKTGIDLLAVAEVECELGRCEQALVHVDRGIALLEGSAGLDPETLARAHVCRAGVLANLGRFAEARTLAEAALAKGTLPATSGFVLAQALWAEGRRAPALTAARKALDAARADRPKSRRVADIEAWIASR